MLHFATLNPAHSKLWHMLSLHCFVNINKIVLVKLNHQISPVIKQYPHKYYSFVAHNIYMLTGIYIKLTKRYLWLTLCGYNIEPGIKEY